MSELSKTVLRTLNIFELIINSGKSLSLEEIVNISGRNKTSVFRSLKTLEAKGYIKQDESNKRYSPTLKLTTLSRRVVSKMDIRRVFNPIIRELVNEINIASHLSVRESKEVVFIENIDPVDSDFKLSFEIGKRSPIYCTAAGKVFLAYLSEEERDKLLSQIQLKKYTENTITNKDKLLKELKKIKQNGYAIDDEEHNKDIMCLAAPIIGYGNNVDYVISIIGLANNIKGKKVEKLGEVVKKYADLMGKKY